MVHHLGGTGCVERKPLLKLSALRASTSQEGQPFHVHRSRINVSVGRGEENMTTREATVPGHREGVYGENMRQAVSTATHPCSGDQLMTGRQVTIIAAISPCIPLLPSPIHVSLRVGPKPFEGLVRFPSHPQLIDLYRRVTVFHDAVLHPERRCRPGVFLAIRRSVSGWQMENEH